MPLNVAQLTPDAEQAGLLEQIHAAAFSASSHWSAQDFAADLSSRIILADSALRSGVLVLQAIADEAEVLTLGVVPSARGQGLAHALMEHGLRIVRDRNIKNIFLEVADDNAPAIGLYRRLGFRETGRRQKYYRRANGDKVDALVMSMRLG